MSAKEDYGVDTDMKEESCTEINSHAKMPVLRRHNHVISDTFRIAEVNPFTTDYEAMHISIIDSADIYDCPYKERDSY